MNNRKRYIGAIEIPNGRGGTRRIANTVLYATSLEKAMEQYDKWTKVKGNVPVWADVYSQTQIVELAAEFQIEVNKVKALRWWEREAIDAAKRAVKAPDWLEYDLASLARSIEDGWSETIQRDGEPGPRPGNVDFEVDDAETKLIIRSTRILAVITIKAS